jgi:hypothetical protein
LIVIGNSIATAERHIIKSNTDVLGGVLLTRTGIVVDLEENPEPYEYTYRTVDEEYVVEADTPAEDVAEAVVRSVRAAIPFDTYEYKKVIRNEAAARGVTRLTPDDRIGLSEFFFKGGLCHQQALLTATTLTLLQQRRGIEGKISVDSTMPNEHDPDRHVLVRYTTEDADLLLDSLGTGVREFRPRHLMSMAE